jgi:hypothetical protein
MPFTNYGTQATIWNIGSQLTNNYVRYFGLGIGSGTALVSNVTLVTESGARVAITGSPNFTVANKVTFQGDWNSILMSGVLLTEFGLFSNNTNGSTWQRESFPTVTFDGTNELQILTTIEAIPG